MRPGKQLQMVSLAPLLDALVIANCGWLAYYLRWDHWNMPLAYLVVLILGTALSLVFFPMGGAYRSWRGDPQWRDVGNALPGLLMVALVLTLIGTLTKTSADFSRLWMGYWFVLAALGL